MTPRLPRMLREFSRSNDGVAAIEFAVIAPLLLILLALGIETSRAYQAHRMFENAVTGIGRAIAGSPEYDAKLRTVAPLIGTALLPPDAAGRFNLQVTSLVKEGAAMTQLYTHTLFGTNPNLPFSSSAAASKFDQNEIVVHLAASYKVVPVFSILPGLNLTKTYTVMPYFSRKQIWNEGNSPDKYVN